MKDEDSTKVKIDTKIDFTILDNENLQIVTSHQGAFNDIVAAHQVEVMRLKDEGIRQALVKLGWTPPGMAPSIHEDNARTLQGIIDDLRIILGAADGERITDAARRATTKQPAHATQPAEVTDEHLSVLQEMADRCPELNLSNYDSDDVDELNSWAVEIAVYIDGITAQAKKEDE